MTVSRAFRSDASIGDETRKNILRIADELGYVFDARASSLRSQRSGFIALTVPTINNPNFAETLDGLSREIADAGLQALIGYDNYDVTAEEHLIKQLLYRRPEAIVVTGSAHTDHARAIMTAADVPVVEIWDLPKQPIQHVVGFSNAAAMERLVDHLVATGRRRIAFIGGDLSHDTRGVDRRRGFVAAMKRHGLDPRHLVPIGGPSTVAKGADAMSRLLESTAKVDAVIGVFDYAAFGALTECQRRGVSVPDDIAIAGFGATEIAACAHPSLTTIDPHCADIGRRTGMLITDLLKHPHRESGPIQIGIGPVLKIGLSTRS